MRRFSQPFVLLAALLLTATLLAGCANAQQTSVQPTSAATLQATVSAEATVTPESNAAATAIANATAATAAAATAASSTGGGASGIAAQGTPVEGQTPTLDETAAAELTPSVAQELLEMAGIATLAGIAPTRTPLPIPTPDIVLDAVNQALVDVGVQDQSFLWLEYSDWISLLASLLLILIAYVVGILLVNRYTQALARRAGGRSAERLFLALAGHARWLLVIWAASLGTRRLEFLNSATRTTLEDIYFFAALLVLVHAAWRLIGMVVRRGGLIASGYGPPERMNSFVTLFAWFLYGVVVVTALTFIFNHYAINITGLALFIGIAGLGLSLAGRDVLADLIAGMTILVDQPFRIGDRVDLMDLNTVGVVHEIGMRSTRIITANNRMVVVPNSLMAQNQVINYSFPDPALNDGSEIRVAYENDAAHVTRALGEAIRSVEGVQVDKPVAVTLNAFTETCIVFRMSWWVHSAVDAGVIRDLVNRAALEKLQAEGIHLPYARQHVLAVQPEPTPQEPPPPERPFSTTPTLAEGGGARESLL